MKLRTEIATVLPWSPRLRDGNASAHHPPAPFSASRRRVDFPAETNANASRILSHELDT